MRFACTRAFQTARRRTDTGRLTVAVFLQVVYCTIRQVLQVSHMAPRIRSLRLHNRKTHVSESVLAELGLAQRPEVSSAFPDEEQMQYIFLSELHKPFTGAL